MSALLILGGLLLSLLGWLWLWLRVAREHWFWALAGVFPPLALLSGVLNWRVVWLPLLVFLTGLGALSGGLWQLWLAQPEQLERLVRGQWSDYPVVAGQDQLQGSLQGQSFVPDRVRFQQGVLSLPQGQDFIASKEVRLDLSAYGAALLDEQFTLDILPTDRGELPMIEVLWRDAATGQPQARRIVHGYTLRLELQRQAEELKGQLYLSLPSQLATMLNGSFTVAAADEQPDPLWSFQEESVADSPRPVEQQAVQQDGMSENFTLERLLADPEAYLYRTLYIETTAGRQVRGQFQGINEDAELLIRQVVKAPGFVVFQVAPVEIAQIRLEN